MNIPVEFLPESYWLMSPFEQQSFETRFRASEIVTTRKNLTQSVLERGVISKDFASNNSHTLATPAANLHCVTDGGCSGEFQTEKK